MAEYVKIEAIKKSIAECFGDLTEKDAEYIVERVPDADVVEVVRCKDCENYSGKYCSLTDDTEDRREPDDYCSYGERKCDNGKQ